MKTAILAFVLVGVFVLAARAEPVPEPAKASKAKFRAAADLEDVDQKDTADDGANAKGDASSGRLFMKKFLLFKNMFGGQQQQPVIPIIIAGGTGAAGTLTSPAATSPTYTTLTETGSIPTATGTITTTPTGRGERERAGYSNDEEGVEEEEEALAVDEQELQAALAAGAQEYVVTEQEIKGTSDAKVSRPNRVNLRRKGAKRGQVVSVRIPPQYRQYFKNGQKVMLNTSNRPGLKRRGVTQRVKRVRRRKGGNRRRVQG